MIPAGEYSSRWSVVALLMVFTFSNGLKPLTAADRSDGERLFDPNHVFDVQVTMAANDWDQLREEAYDFAAYRTEAYLTNPPESPYTVFKADVTIDGTTLKSVGVRKKGFLGSVNTVRPSLKLDFDEYVDDREFLGSSRFTLQNNQTDRPQMAQALANYIYHRAGVPAPRCNFARVTVNGQYLGVYTHIEAVKKPFLRRAFGDDAGNLYEGRLADFRSGGWLVNFDQKTNKKDGSRSDLKAVVKALEVSDDQLVASVSEVVDLDKFINFWATTSLIRFWDSYPGSANNYFCYRNPKSGKFEFIPWAPDSAFNDNWFEINPRPKSIYAEGYLAHRLYGISEIRDRYRMRMNQLLADVWHENELLAEIQRMEDIIRPHSVRPAKAWETQLEKLRETIRTRRSEVTADMAALPEKWPYPAQQEVVWKPIGSASCRFAFPKAGGVGTAPAELSVRMNGREEKFARVEVMVVPGDGAARIMILGYQHDTGGIGIVVPASQDFLESTKPVPLDGNHITSWLVRFDTASHAPALKLSGVALNLGEVTFSKGDGDTVNGLLNGELLKIPIH